eukprot:gene17018-18732_t
MVVKVVSDNDSDQEMPVIQTEKIEKVGKDAVAGLPNEEALLALMDSTGYPITQNNGQRRYGPPLKYVGPTPTRGSEVFVGKLPRDCFEDELVPVFETVGKIYEMRLMMDFNGQNRGYAFVVFFTKRDAQKAVRTLNNHEIRKGRLIGVCQSVDNCRLFVGGIPKKVKRDEILDEISKVTDHVRNVIVYPSANDKTKNRGFAFVEFESHRAAAMARRKLMSGRIQLWGHPIAVDWAEPEQDVDEEIMEQVKVLYVRNLHLSTTEETIEQIFKQFSDVERVKKIKDYCFVHFTTKEGARTALGAMQGETIDDAEVEVTLAKPVDKEHYRHQKAVAKLMQMAHNYQGYSMVPPEPQSPPPFAFPGQFPPAGLVYPPGYVSRNPVGVRPLMRGRGRTAAGSRSAGGRAYLLNGFLPSLNQAGPGYMNGMNFQVRRRHVSEVMENGLYDLYPGMELTPTNPVTLKPEANRSPIQVLEELSHKNNWGAPIYTLHSTVISDGQLFLYKVTLPLLGTTYQPPKLCRTLEEAKKYAAEYTINQLGDSSSSPQLSPVVTTAPAQYQVRALAPGLAAVSSRPNDGNFQAAYAPITTTQAVVAKVSWPAGVPPGPDGVYGSFEYPEQQAYATQNVYSPY